MAAQPPDRRNKLIESGFRAALLALVAVFVLVGCGLDSNSDTDDEGHRFASDKRPTKVVMVTDESIIGISEESPLDTLATPSPEDIISRRGAPLFIYLVIDSHLQVYDTGSQAFDPVEVPDDLLILDFASSPTGDRIGILALKDDKVVVQFYGADGAALTEATELTIAASPAFITPIASPDASPVVASPPAQISGSLYVTWVPQGNAVIVSGPGVMQRVSMNGAVVSVSQTGVTGTVVEALWSPMDSQILIVAQFEDRHQTVYLLDTGQDIALELEPLELLPGEILSDLQWLPNGTGVAAVVGKNRNGVLMNGQIFVYRFDKTAPQLVATSGQGGPAASITQAVVSPDGNSVAYVIMVQDLNEWYAHSLWVKPLAGGSALSIPLESWMPITSIVWTSEGLVWQQADGRAIIVDSTLQPRPLGETLQSTPVASPIGSPFATPQPTESPRG